MSKKTVSRDLAQSAVVQNFTRHTLPRNNLIFPQIHKSGKGMLLQYSGAALVRDADIEMAK